MVIYWDVGVDGRGCAGFAYAKCAGGIEVLTVSGGIPGSEIGVVICWTCGYVEYVCIDGGACEYRADWSSGGAFVDGAVTYDTGAASGLALPTTFCCDDCSNDWACASAAGRGSKIDWNPGKFEIDDGGGTFAANCCGLNVGTAAAVELKTEMYLLRCLEGLAGGKLTLDRRRLE